MLMLVPNAPIPAQKPQPASAFLFLTILNVRHCPVLCKIYAGKITICAKRAAFEGISACYQYRGSKRNIDAGYAAFRKTQQKVRQQKPTAPR